MRILLVAAVLLGTLPGASTEALSQETDDGAGESRLGRVERRVDEAEDVIVEQVLALRRRVETLEDRVRVLEAELTELRRSPPPSGEHGLLPRPKPHAPSPPQRLK
jgi:hypothetical protein